MHILSLYVYIAAYWFCIMRIWHFSRHALAQSARISLTTLCLLVLLLEHGVPSTAVCTEASDSCWFLWWRVSVLLPFLLRSIFLPLRQRSYLHRSDPGPGPLLAAVPWERSCQKGSGTGLPCAHCVLDGISNRFQREPDLASVHGRSARRSVRRMALLCMDNV